MANAAQGYRSPVDLGLGSSPLTADQEMFGELQDIYNAIHLMNAYLDRLRLAAEGGGSGQTPLESLPFNKFFVAKALDNISVGQAVSPAFDGQDGMFLGARPDSYTSGDPRVAFCGVALTAAPAGQNFRVGVGPGVIEVPGAVTGGFVWTFSSRTTAGGRSGQGNFYASYPGAIGTPGGTAYPIAVGNVIAPNYALIGKYIPSTAG